MVALKNPADMSSSGLLHAFLDLQHSWNITDEEGCTLIRANIADQSKPGAQWDTDQMERLGYLFSIDRMLSGFFTQKQKQTWLRTTQAGNVFGNQSVLQKMLIGRVSDLYLVERWLRSRLELM